MSDSLADTGRGREADYLILAFASVGAPYPLLHAAGLTEFLVRLGPEGLPLIFAASALAAAAAAAWVAYLSRRVDLRGLLVGLILARAAVAVGLRIAIGQGWGDEAAIFGAIWGTVDIAIAAEALRRLIHRELGAVDRGPWHTRFALVEPAAIALGGVAGALLVNFVAIADLYLVAAGVTLVSILPLVVAETRGGAEHARPEPPLGMARRPLSRRLQVFLAVLIGMVGAWMLTRTALGVAAYSYTQGLFPAPAALAAALSYALSGAGVAALALTLYGRERLLTLCGIGGALLIPGAVGAALTAGAAALWMAEAPPILIFALIIAVWGVERSTFATLFQPAFITLFDPLPETHRRRAVMLTRRLARPVAGALAGLVIFAAASLWPGPAALLSAAAGSIVLIALTLAARRIYVGALEWALMRGQSFHNVNLGAADRASREVIQRMIRGGEHGAVAAARIQASLDPDGFANAAPRLIARGDASMVLQLLTTVPQIAAPRFFPPMSGRLTVEEDPALRDALLTAAAATGHPNSPRLLARAVADQPENPPLGALVGLGRDGGPYGAAIAGQFLERAASRGGEALRRALDAVARIGAAAPSGPVALGLAEPDRVTRMAAIRAAGKLRDPAIAPLLAARLSEPRERRAATLALSEMGAPAVETLAQAAGDRQLDVRARVASILALGAVGGAEALGHVVNHAASRNVRIAAAAHIGLWRGEWVGARDQVAPVMAQSRVFIGHAAEIRLARAALDMPGAELMVAALDAAGRRALTRAVRAAALGQSPHARPPKSALCARFGDRRDHEAARRLALTVLPPEMRPAVLTLLEDPSAPLDEEARASLTRLAGEAPEDPEDLLSWIADRAAWRTDWLTALSLAALSDTLDLEALEGLADNPGPATLDTLRALGRRKTGDPHMALSVIEKVVALKATDLFSLVPDEDLAEVAPHMSSVYLDPGEVVIRQGEMGDELYLMIAGEVEVERDGEILGKLTEGEVFGDLAALDPEPRAATIRAVAPSHALVLANEHLLELFESNVEIASGVIGTLVGRLRKGGKY